MLLLPMVLLPMLLLLLQPGPAGARRRVPSERHGHGHGHGHGPFPGPAAEEGAADELRRRLLLLAQRPEEAGEGEGNSPSPGGRAAASAAAAAAAGPDGDLPSPSEHRVKDLPLLDDAEFRVAHFAGHLPAGPDPDDKKLFYWLFAPDAGGGDDGSDGLRLGSDPSVPLVIWLNGGPGCSSMDGLFLENGPLKLVPGRGGWRMVPNPHSWHLLPAWTLYIDQPVGTGLSYTAKGNYCQNDGQVDADFHYFLTSFLRVYSDMFLVPIDGDDGMDRLRLNRPLYFSGESHAGHYIPSMMNYILKRNDLHQTDVVIPLSGAAIGNGWVDPYRQYSAADVAYGAGIVDLAQKASLDSKERECQRAMDGGNLDARVCFHLLDDVVRQSGGSGGTRTVSQYDHTKWEEKGKGGGRDFPPGHKDVETYLGGWERSEPPIWAGSGGGGYLEVLKALHATGSVAAGQRYEECTDPPWDALSHQDGLGVVPDVVDVLDHPSRPTLLFFNGMNDLICNHVGNERFLDVLPWKRVKSWTLADRGVWVGGGKGDGSPWGYVKSYENLTFLKIPNSGHMVPMDLPEVSLEMMRVLVLGGIYNDSRQRLDASDPSAGATCEPCPSCSVDGKGGWEEKGSYSPTGDLGKGAMGGAAALVIALSCLCTLLLVRRRRRRRMPEHRHLGSEGGAEGEFDLQLEMNGSKFRDLPLHSDAPSRLGEEGDFT